MRGFRSHHAHLGANLSESADIRNNTCRGTIHVKNGSNVQMREQTKRPAAIGDNAPGWAGLMAATTPWNVKSSRPQRTLSGWDRRNDSKAEEQDLHAGMRF